MKDTEIHNGMENEIMREFFANNLVEIHGSECSNARTFESDKQAIYRLPNDRSDFGSLRNSISRKKIELNFEKTALALLEKKLCVLILMREVGWSDYDISEYIPCSGEHYRCFIGTEKEHENLISKLEKENLEK
jgi:hypothetical protein